MTADDVADHIAIRNLIARYTQTGDASDAEGFSKVFAPDGTIESSKGTHTGRETIRAWKAGGSSFVSPHGPVPVFRRHNLTTTGITLEGPDTASGLVYWFVITDLGPDHSGFYTDRYVKVDGEWLIGRRKVTITWRADNSCIGPDQVSPEFRRS